jgi:hypothetical protein
MDNIKIPKIIHQIWLGENEMPEHCNIFVKDMKAMHPDWEHHLWGNEVFTDIYKDDPFLQSYILDPKLYKWAFIADRVRMLLLRDYGGIYCDVDAKPIRSFNTVRDQLQSNHTFLTGLKPTQENNTLFDCTVYGSAPGSRAVTEILSVYESLTWAHGCKRFSDKLIHIMEPDIACFGYEYFYNWEVNSKTVVLHDVTITRLMTWVDNVNQRNKDNW